MTITIYTVDKDPIGIDEDAQEVLLMLDLPIKSPWFKVKTNYGWLWIDRSSIIKVKVFEYKKSLQKAQTLNFKSIIPQRRFINERN